MIHLAVETFIRVIEIWVPRTDGRRLEIESASYQNIKGFQEASHGMRFAKGEGLPGMVWQAKRPIVLEDFSGPIFLRKQAAEGAGLAAGIGIPVFDQDVLQAVVVLLCGDPSSSAGALEVWSRDVQHQELRLSSGYYGSLKNLRYISNRIRFEKGVGLPGQVWASGLPVMMDNLAHTKAFIRANTARAEVLKTGLGIPVMTQNRVDHVVLMLSALDTPLARVFEIWKPNGSRLVLEAGSYGAYENLAQLYNHKQPTSKGLVDDVWKKRKPVLMTRDDAMHWAQAHVPQDERFQTGLGVPIMDEKGIRAVVVLLM